MVYLVIETTDADVSFLRVVDIFLEMCVVKLVMLFMKVMFLVIVDIVNFMFILLICGCVEVSFVVAAYSGVFENDGTMLKFLGLVSCKKDFVLFLMKVVKDGWKFLCLLFDEDMEFENGLYCSRSMVDILIGDVVVDYIEILFGKFVC